MDQPEKKHKILLTGGGTGGSVAPLLAVAEDLTTQPPLLVSRGGAEAGVEFLWLGTKQGVERAMVEKAGLKFKAIAAGKWRRYFSLKNFWDLIKIKIGFWQALWTIMSWRPDLVMSAGSFVSVPVVWAAWLLRVPVLIHQQDAKPGLANKLMAPFAKAITVTFEKSLRDYGKKAVWTGNPTRRSLAIKNYELKITNFKIRKDLPVVLVVGGGTGAAAINELVEQGLGELTKFCQIIHVTGKNKSIKNYEPASLAGGLKITNYKHYEFLDAEQMAAALKLAEVVVTRAGMSVLSELAYLKKPAIIIPMPESHQVENARMFTGAGLVLEQKSLTVEKLVNEIKGLLGDEARRRELGEKMGRAMKQGANEAMVEIINKILNLK
ncbi:MAG: undecaprenyldiphospho-muramoylpentapeptide beta-N-acetylglucosaminyltransferase [Patescibacteria group bacterium]|nr:undecaprenyldiphospho-muramoylpentapeptide beta-N-acetylglucosaminyltransferase [Patescibacteria group bacterium]